VKPGERIDRIKEIANALDGQEWGEIDLTLEQFGFQASDSWEGSKTDYLIAHVKDGTDQALTDLHDYLCPAEDAAGEAPPPQLVQLGAAPWQTDGYRLFVTHLAKEKTNVSKLAEALSVHSIEGFIAHESIEAGAEWREVILSGLDTCHGLAAWLTVGVRESDWCDQEIGYALARKRMIVPVRFGQDPYGFIGKYQGLTVANKQPLAEIARSIFDLLLRDPRSRGDMAEVLVNRFRRSRSFEAVRTNVGYLRRIPPEAWTDLLKASAMTAHEENGQIEQAFVGQSMAPNVVAKLIGDLP
jgi:hypothetical protein